MSASALSAAPAETFTVAALPDMQSYAYPATDVYRRLTRWIAENKEEQRIAFVSHLGDAVDKPGERGQWGIVREAMRELDGQVPYAVALGNHDFLPGWDTLYHEHFPPGLFAGEPWHGGAFEHSSFQLVSAEGVDMLFLHLECNARDHVLAWADEVLAGHPGRPAAVSTHCYLGRLAKGLPREERWYAPRGRIPWSRFADGNSGQDMWEKCLCKHPNVFLVMSGDQAYVQALRQTSVGHHGNPVHELVSDYSYASRDLVGAHADFFRECGLPPGEVLREADYRKPVLARAEFGRERTGSMADIKKKSGHPVHSPDGRIRLLRFLPSCNRIEVRTFSPLTGEVCLGNPVVPDPGQHRFDLEGWLP